MAGRLCSAAPLLTSAMLQRRDTWLCAGVGGGSFLTHRVTGLCNCNTMVTGAKTQCGRPLGVGGRCLGHNLAFIVEVQRFWQIKLITPPVKFSWCYASTRLGVSCPSHGDVPYANAVEEMVNRGDSELYQSTLSSQRSPAKGEGEIGRDVD